VWGSQGAPMLRELCPSLSCLALDQVPACSLPAVAAWAPTLQRVDIRKLVWVMGTGDRSDVVQDVEQTLHAMPAHEAFGPI